jgi:hypothetical protein
MRTTPSRLERLASRLGFAPSELASVLVAALVAKGFWHQTAFPSSVFWLLPAAWLLASTGLQQLLRPGIGRMGGAAASLLGAAACALVLYIAATPFSLRQGAGFFVCLSLLLACTRAALRVTLDKGGSAFSEGVRFAAAQAAALYAVHPFMRSAILGAGDADSYSLAIADFIRQRRAGIFPVFIGQSIYSFNGGFQPIRNAPGYEHLAWLFHVLAFHTLNEFALQNLVVIASMMGGTLGCYVALRVLAPGRRWTALVLAAVFSTSPAILAPLYGGDMYLTFAALPFIPMLVLGIAAASRQSARAGAWLLQGVALAGLWWMHPPVACWASMLSLLAGLWVIARERSWRTLHVALAAAMVSAVLSGYVFVSVHLLSLPAAGSLETLGTIPFKMQMLRDGLASSFLPMSHDISNLIGDIQLGCGVWVCLLVGCASSVRIRSLRPLVGCAVVILLFLFPIPFITRFLWSSLPVQVLAVMNQWPMERLYPLLAVFAVIIIGTGFDRLQGWAPPGRILALVLLAGALSWSVSEMPKFFERAREVAHTEAESINQHLRENLMVSRTHSYEYLGTPPYFSFGHADPSLENRLIDARTWEVFADGAARVGGPSAHPADSRTLDLQLGGTSGPQKTLRLEPGLFWSLDFDFQDPSPRGELQITGGSLRNFYSLPMSGYPLAFGTGAHAAHTLIVGNSTDIAEDAVFSFVAPAGEILRTRVLAAPIVPDDLVIRVESWTPFSAVVKADRACFLETPKLFVPGYQASVDHAPEAVISSANGLVAVPVPRGEHLVQIAYKGSTALRASYYVSITGWLAVLGFVGALAFRMEGPLGRWLGRLRPALDVDPWLRRGLVGAVVLGALTLAVAFGARWRNTAGQVHEFGSLRMVIKLPFMKTGRNEPLLATGVNGRGDLIYVTYLDGGHIQVAHDKWNFGGAKSGPIAVDYTRVQTVEISQDSLYAGSAAGPSSGISDKDGRSPKRGLWVKWNGQTVLAEAVDAYPATPAEVEVGRNSIGASTASKDFSGTVLSVSRGGP